MGSPGQAQGFSPAHAAQVQALSGNTQLYLVHAKPFLHVLKVFFLDKNAFFRQALGKFVVRKGNKSELMAVKPAHVDAAIALGHHAQAGNGVHSVVIADAKCHLVQKVLQKVARPGYRIFFRKAGKILKPLGPAYRQLVCAAALLHQQIARSLVKGKMQHTRRQLAHQIHKGPALHADKPGLSHFCLIASRKLDIGIGGHDRKTAVFRLEPDGAQILRPCLGGNNGNSFQQPFNDLLFINSKFHTFFP